ncbi:cytochrome P450 [Paracoccus siganidrum]|uniref:Cytochrome P450 n=1 Tax=Paracoccus siganidrum TaxID=1276757 RepID=A0A419AAN5_9RHOB|nr:cytochrome P450 [Paracoccus siganidrum]RJL20134.1 cytochrome P450 [Paracoccus siganidrum]RMC32561.1 cytochrome P450 [Paracoccus siganidrum]
MSRAPQTLSPPPSGARPAEPVKVELVDRPLGILATAMTARRNVLELIPGIALRQPIVSGRLGIRWHMVMDPECLRRILKDRVEDYPKSVTTKLILEPAIGDSLFIAEGAHWRWQRRAAAPAFAQRHVEALGPVMTAAAEASCRRIRAATGPVDLFQEAVAATFEVISDVTFSGDGGFDRDAVHHAINGYISQTAKVSVLDVLGLPPWVPRPGRLLSGGGLKRMKAVADRAIAARAEAAARDGPPDLLDLLLDAQDPETGRAMNRDELRDNLLTFIVAGHETTALTIAWALYLCAFDPAVQERAAAEARAALGERAATAADLEALPLVHRIVHETLRLYPTAAFLSRTARAPDRLCGREVRPGDTVMLPIYALHRHHLLWDRPDAFDPDRFLTPPDRYAFLPFGAGPRICIGASFAIQEAVIILATLLARFRFAALPGRDPVPHMILTLRPKGGVWLRATPR